MKQTFIKANNYSHFGKLTKVEIFLIFLTIFILPFLILYLSKYTILVFIYLIIFFILIEFAYQKEVLKDQSFFTYRVTFNYFTQILHIILELVFLVLFIFHIFYHSEIPQFINSLITWALGICFLLYMFLLGIFLVLLINLIFFIVLKKIFPNTLDTKNFIEKVKLKDISSFLTIEEQITYLGLSIVHFTFYLIGFAFYSIALLQVDNSIDDYTFLQKLVDWSKDNDIISLGNFLGLLSIMITVFSITIPSQVKIKRKGIKRKNSPN